MSISTEARAKVTGNSSGMTGEELKIGPASYRSNEMFAPPSIEIAKVGDGCLMLHSPMELNPFGRSVCEYLPRWAKEAHDRTFLAERTASHEWRAFTYAQAWNATRSLGEALLAMGAKPGDRIALLSGNSIDHALLMLAGMAIGCCISPISPNYSLLRGGFGRLEEIGRILKPAFVFAQSGQTFGMARGIAEFSSARWITGDKSAWAVPIAELLATSPGRRFDDAFGALKQEMIAKILFTSGSTGKPKGVINTHQMLVSAVEMVEQLVKSPPAPVRIEWMPWHHTMGGNTIFNGILRNGGTLYIDEGRPVPESFQKTIANLREISPTTMLNVPAAYVMLVDALEKDTQLRERFFKDLRYVLYGGAAIPGSTIERFQALAVQTVGSKIPILSGYGATEAASIICLTHWPSEQPGELGLPPPGLTLKLTSAEGRYELRIKGPNVTPGYYGQPDLNAEAFDEDGFYKVGDTVTFVDQSRPERGLLFAGRVSENFKLNNGTWVIPDEIRKSLINASGGALQDAVVAGENRDSIAVLLWPSSSGAARYVRDQICLKDPAALAADGGLIGHFKRAVAAHNRERGSSSRVRTFALLVDPPSLASGELTDKASVNQRVTLKNRSQLVERLYMRPLPSDIFEPAP
jgi:feruloyl-CoA synthase